MPARRDFAAWVALVVIGVGLAADPAPLVGLVAIALGGMVAARSLSACVAATMTALPFVAHPFTLGDWRFAHLELALALTAFALAVDVGTAMWHQRSLAAGTALLRPWGVTMAALVVATAGCIATTRVADPEHLDASLRALRTVLLEPLILLPATRRVLRGGGATTLLAGLAAGAIAASVWALAQIGSGGGLVADDIRRATGPFTHPNGLAFLLERAIPLLAVAVVWRQSGLARIGGALGLAIAAAALVATFSRGAAVALPVACVLAAALVGQRRILAAAVGAGITGTALFALVAGERLLATGPGVGFSRMPLWQSSLRMLRDYPLSGIGPDQFYAMYGTRYVEPAAWAERFTSHPHNLLLDAWLTLGVPGAALVVLFLGWLAVSGRAWHRIFRRPGRPAGIHLLALGAWIALVAGVGHGMLDNGFFLPDLAAFTWVAAALLAEGLTRTMPVGTS